MELKEKHVDRIGWFAAVIGISMYASYIDQIRLNLGGHPGSVILPVMTVINCCFWIIYGFLLKKKNWPSIACNLPGVVLGIITALTAMAIIH
jgi:uncharacterized protein with PQ loop repeat